MKRTGQLTSAGSVAIMVRNSAFNGSAVCASQGKKAKHKNKTEHFVVVEKSIVKVTPLVPFLSPKGLFNFSFFYAMRPSAPEVLLSF